MNAQQLKTWEAEVEYLQEKISQQQAEIEALKEARCVACGWNPNLIKKASDK
jgi:multidrug resistance efflux pump